MTLGAHLHCVMSVRDDVTLVTAGGKGGKGGKKRKQAAQDGAADAAAPDDADAGAVNGSAEAADDKSRLQGRCL
jgi:hypothetical protein